MFTLVDTIRLRAFREVVAHRSFTAAATALGISQPAVSQHIAKLEQEIGAPLLVRGSRGLRVTPPGAVLLRRIDELLAHLRDTADELAVATGEDGGELRMATFPSAAASIVPPVVGALRRLVPRATVTLREADPADALPELLAGQHDLALVYDYPILATPRDARLHWQVLAEDAMAAALPATHPLADNPRVPLAALATDSWVTPHPSPCREALERACRQAGFTPDVVSETNDYMAMLGLVAAGVGVAVVPRLITAGAAPAGVVLRPLAPGLLLRTVAAVTSPSGHHPPIRRKTIHLLESMISHLVDPDLPLSAPTATPARANLRLREKAA